MTTIATSPKLDELEGKLKERRDRLGGIFAEAGPDLDMDKVKCLDGDSASKVEQVRTLNEEIDDLAGKADDERALIKAYNASKEREDAGDGPAGEPGDSNQESGAAKDFADLLIKGGALDAKHVEVEHPDIDVKTLFQTSAGWAPDSFRTQKLVEDAQRPVELVDLIPQTTTGATGSVTYWEETTFTNNAAETTEANSYAEAALALTEQTATIRKITISLPVTDEQLEDRPRARGYINNRLPFMLRQRLSNQIATGDGSAPNLRGILNVVGIQTQALGADSVPDAVYKAIVKVQTGTGQAMPNAYVTNPADWQDVRLLQTTDGIYIWGAPSDAGPDRIWGLNVVKAEGMTATNGVVGDFANFSELAVRKGVTTEIGYNSDDFSKGKQTLRADLRAALIWYRPAAFCSVTGL